MRTAALLCCALSAAAAQDEAAAEAPSVINHCANAAGNLIGLASDEKWHLRLPNDAPDNPEKWTLVAGDVLNSFTGRYVQVLPDDRDTYNTIYGPGSFVMTGLDFTFVVDEAGAGVHTLFLRWSAGSTKGDGDSLYVVVRDGETDALVPGQPTFKPLLVDIEDSRHTGCCYNAQTHECTCHVNRPRPENCEVWVEAESAAKWGAQCPADEAGATEAVREPLWYLFAGQSDPDKMPTNKMDFDVEPWDSTCEAVGMGTRDTGLNFAAWDLKAGTYRLVFYPREDGTALDAWHLAGPDGGPPSLTARLHAGDSTVNCNGESTLSDAPKPSEVVHEEGDAEGWGHRDGGKDSEGDEQVSCGRCLVALTDPAECPAAEVLATLPTCDNVTLGHLCEADGECGTDLRLNNCGKPTHAPDHDEHPTGLDGPRHRANRNNDVYRRVACPEAPPPQEGGGGWAVFWWLFAIAALGGVAWKSLPAVRAYVTALGGGIRHRMPSEVLPGRLFGSGNAAGPMASAGMSTPYVGQSSC